MRRLNGWKVVSLGEMPEIDDADFEKNSFSFRVSVAGRIDDARVPIRFEATNFSVVGVNEFAVTGSFGSQELTLVLTAPPNSMVNPRTVELWNTLAVFGDNWQMTNVRGSK